MAQSEATQSRIKWQRQKGVRVERQNERRWRVYLNPKKSCRYRAEDRADVTFKAWACGIAWRVVLSLPSNEDVHHQLVL